MPPSFYRPATDYRRVFGWNLTTPISIPRAEAAAVTSFDHRRGRRIIGVDQQSDPPGGGDNLVQQSQLLYRNLGEGKVDAGRVAARPGEADEASRNEHDRAA